jgi:hypothetical protein
MKICPKCRYLDHEENGPNYECPKCGVIYSRAFEAINEEKIKQNEMHFAHTWAKAGSNTQKNAGTFWVWVAVFITIITFNVIRNIRTSGINHPTQAVPVAKTPVHSARENFLTKYEMRTQEKGTCSFKLTSNNAPNTIFILTNRITGQKTALLYVKRGDELEIQVPPGEYGYQMIQGEVWLGEKEHFGLGTVYFDGDRTLVFEQNERGTSGHIVKLNTMNGNMKPVRTARIDLK